MGNEKGNRLRGKAYEEGGEGRMEGEEEREIEIDRKRLKKTANNRKSIKTKKNISHSNSDDNCSNSSNSNNHNNNSGGTSK